MKEIKGIIPAVITPMNEDESISRHGLAVIERVLAGGSPYSPGRRPIRRARRAQERLAPLRRAFSLSTFPGVLKEGAEIVGLPAGSCRRPVGKLPPQKRRELDRIISRIL